MFKRIIGENGQQIYIQLLENVAFMILIERKDYIVSGNERRHENDVVKMDV